MKLHTDQELEVLLDDIESDLVERKRSFKGDAPRKARQAVLDNVVTIIPVAVIR